MKLRFEADIRLPKFSRPSLPQLTKHLGWAALLWPIAVAVVMCWAWNDADFRADVVAYEGAGLVLAVIAQIGQICALAWLILRVLIWWINRRRTGRL